MSLEAQFNTLSMNDLDDYIANKQEEHLQLDFKVVNRADFGHRDDRKNLAKSISGFANSSGGLIVWGIVATKNADGIDCATGKQEIDNLPMFLSKLNELTGQAVSPLVEAVRHRPIASTGNRGFALTLVPESDSGPHMAKLGEDRYYKRSGDSFYKMEHFDIEDMFGRRKKPKLRLRATFAHKSYNRRERSVKVRILLKLENIGRGSAKAPLVTLKPSCLNRWTTTTVSADRVNMNLVSTDKSGALSYYFDRTLHPGIATDVQLIEARFGLDNSDFADLRIDYHVIAENIGIQEDHVTITGDEIADYVDES